MIVVGTNSWVTIIEADTYLGVKNNAENWFTLDDSPVSSGETSKESYLTEAYYRLLYNSSFVLTESLTNSIIKNAQIELAFWLLNNYKNYLKRESMIASGIKSFTFSKWKETLGDIKLPYMITGMIEKAGFAYGNYLVDITVE